MAAETATGKSAVQVFGIRVRRTVGFALAVGALVLLDLRYWIWPRLTGRLGKTGQRENLR